MVQYNTPSPLDQLIHWAQRATVCRSLSHSLPSDQAKVARISSLLQSDTPLNACIGVFANIDIVLQFLFISDGNIFPITCPTIALANSLVDPPVYVGSMSDKLDEAIPIVVAADEFQVWCTTLIPTADAQTYHL